MRAAMEAMLVYLLTPPLLTALPVLTQAELQLAERQAVEAAALASRTASWGITGARDGGGHDSDGEGVDDEAARVLQLTAAIASDRAAAVALEIADSQKMAPPPQPTPTVTMATPQKSAATEKTPMMQGMSLTGYSATGRSPPAVQPQQQQHPPPLQQSQPNGHGGAALHQQQQHAQQPFRAGLPGGGSTTNVATELMKLKQLLDAGVITKEIFDRGKKKALGL
jgi:hypothetical protein